MTQSADTTTQILDATDALVLADGPAAVTLERIAAAAGIDADQVAGLFPDRDHLLEAAMMRHLETVNRTDLLPDRLYINCAADLIMALHSFYVDAWSQRPVLARIWHEPGGGRLAGAEAQRRITELAAGIHATLAGLELIAPDVTAADIREIVVMANDARGRGLAGGQRHEDVIAEGAADVLSSVSERFPPPGRTTRS